MVMGDGRNAVGAVVAASVQALYRTGVQVYAFALCPTRGRIRPNGAQGADTALERWQSCLWPIYQIQSCVYRDHDELRDRLSTVGADAYVVLYLGPRAVDDGLDLSHILEPLSGAGRPRIAGLTLLVDDSCSLGVLGVNRLGYLNLMESVRGDDYLVEVAQQVSCPVRFLMVGVWEEAFGHPGSYVVGCPDAVELLSVKVDLAASSASPSPVQVAMTLRALRDLQENKVSPASVRRHSRTSSTASI